MGLITQQILKPDFTLTINDVVYDRRYIISQIAKAKTFLIEEKKCIPGQKVLLTAQWPEYLIWFLAGAELGLSFVVVDPNSASYNSIINLYELLDIEITDSIDISSRFEESNEVRATGNSILIYTTSSGTTGSPKIITYSHDFLYQLMIRNSKIYNINDNDRCVHTKTLTHSSIVGIYFLPALYSCSNHYYFNNNFGKQLSNHKITRCAVLREYLQIIYEEFDNNIDYDFTIYVITKIPDEYKFKIVTPYVKLISVFGSSETMGPLFLSEINQLNKYTYNDNNFGAPLDDFYTISTTKDHLLTIGMPSGAMISTGDLFHVTDQNEYIFNNREYCMINGKMIHLTSLRLFLLNVINDEFDLVADEQENQIYIRVDNNVSLIEINKLLLDEYNDSRYQITKQLIGPREKYMNDVKLDVNLIRIKCRECN